MGARYLIYWTVVNGGGGPQGELAAPILDQWNLNNPSKDPSEGWNEVLVWPLRTFILTNIFQGHRYRKSDT